MDPYYCPECNVMEPSCGVCGRDDTEVCVRMSLLCFAAATFIFFLGMLVR